MYQAPDPTTDPALQGVHEAPEPELQLTMTLAEAQAARSWLAWLEAEGALAELEPWQASMLAALRAALPAAQEAPIEA